MGLAMDARGDGRKKILFRPSTLIFWLSVPAKCVEEQCMHHLHSPYMPVA